MDRYSFLQKQCFCFLQAFVLFVSEADESIIPFLFSSLFIVFLFRRHFTFVFEVSRSLRFREILTHVLVVQLNKRLLCFLCFAILLILGSL